MTETASDSPSYQVLVVDDDQVDVKAIKRHFTKANWNGVFHWAKDGIEALELLRGKGGVPKLKPDLILIDINMPRMGGIELMSTIREDRQLRGCLVYVLTTSKRAEDIKTAYDLDVSGYIFKEQMESDFEKLMTVMAKV